jgi:hypothetical protein
MAARNARHAARVEAAAPQVAAEAKQPISRAPDDLSSEQPTTELAAAGGVVPDREWSRAAAWTTSLPTLPARPLTRSIRTITSNWVRKQKPARTAGDRKNAVTQMRRRAIASVAIASLVAGGTSYFVSENVIPTTPTPLPPQAANQPSMDADVWVDKAEVVLASLSSQLDAVAQAEASWLALPAQRRAQEPAAVQALKERKALLEQQRATLMSQLEAFKALPERTSELTSAQAQLDAVERTLNESTSTAASPDYQEALRQLESQREMRRQQRDHAAQALTDLRNGVEQALSAPLPAEKDETTPIVERVKAVVEGRPDPAEKDDDQEHKAADDQDPAATQRREDDDEERGDVGTTAPPDPERPNTPDILADGGGNAGSDNGSANGSANGSDEANGGDRPDGALESVAGALGSALGQGDTTNRDESANKREIRDDSDSNNGTGDNGGADDNAADDDRGDNGGGLGDVVRGVTGGLLGGSDDDEADDRGESRGRGGDRDDDRGGDRDDDRGGDRDDDRGGDRDDDRGGDRGDRSGWLSDRGDRDDDDDDDDRGSRRERDDDADDSGEEEEHADEDSDGKRPSGKAERERKREKDHEQREERGDGDDSDGRDDSDRDDSDDRDDDGGNSGKGSDKGDDDCGDSDSGNSNGGDDD